MDNLSGKHWQRLGLVNFGKHFASAENNSVLLADNLHRASFLDLKRNLVAKGIDVKCTKEYSAVFLFCCFH